MLAAEVVRPAVLDSYDAALARARELVPGIRARVAETEELRRLPDATAAELVESGLCGLLTPRQFGGSELGLEAVLDVSGILAEACPSTGWVHALWGAHMWLIALYPPDVQAEVWSTPGSLISSVVATKGVPERVDGGWRWTGSGAYSSGIDHCNWLSPALNVTDVDGVVRRKWLLIPRSDFRIVDDWYTIGLKGTGSKTIVADDVFIPDNRAVASEDMAAGTTPGARYHTNPQYSAASPCIFTPPLAGTAIGAARGFLQAFEDRIRGRLSSADPQQVGEQAGTLIRWAKACADVDAARTVLMEVARLYSRTPSGQLSEVDKARCRRDQAWAATTARQAVNSLFESGGASALFDGSELQRLWRDTNAAAAHHGLTWDVHGMSWGRLSFGLPSNPGGI